MLASASGPAPAARTAGTASPFIRALSEAVPIAALEMARAREHLRWLSDALLAQGLAALGLRALRLAHDVQPGDGVRVRGLAARVRRSGLFRWSLPRGSRLDATRLAGLGLGPLGRAAGLAEDVRAHDPAYRTLGFSLFAIDRNEAAGRWQIRLEEAARSLDLAARAGRVTTTLLGRVESPRGRLEPGDSPTKRVLLLVPELLSELEWGDAIATLVSLDLDLDETVGAATGSAIGALA